MKNINEFAHYIRVYSCAMPENKDSIILHPYLVELKYDENSNKWTGFIELSGEFTFFRIYSKDDKVLKQATFEKFNLPSGKYIHRNEIFYINSLNLNTVC